MYVVSVVSCGSSDPDDLQMCGPNPRQHVEMPTTNASSVTAHEKVHYVLRMLGPSQELIQIRIIRCLNKFGAQPKSNSA